jgi:hypothetical protein
MLVTIKRLTCGYWKSLCLKKIGSEHLEQRIEGRSICKENWKQEDDEDGERVKQANREDRRRK